MGLSRYVRDPQRRDPAEIAIAVPESWQGRGVGKAPLHRLADEAWNEGITRAAFPEPCGKSPMDW